MVGVGYTNDGFAKPEIAAPGRYIVACSSNGSLCHGGSQDSRLAAQRYAQLSGMSFAAPMVSAAATVLLGLHPEWTPDQVKGGRMLTANALPAAVPGSVGVAELDIRDTLDKSLDRNAQSPPNPNLALEGFLAQTPSGPVFNVDGWVSEAKRIGASWSSVSWASASWASSSWASFSWSSASGPAPRGPLRPGPRRPEHWLFSTTLRSTAPATARA